MGLMTDAIIRETPELMRQKVRVKVIGNTGDLPEEVWHKVGRVDSQDGCKYRSDLWCWL